MRFPILLAATILATSPVFAGDPPAEDAVESPAPDAATETQDRPAAEPQPAAESPVPPDLWVDLDGDGNLDRISLPADGAPVRVVLPPSDGARPTTQLWLDGQLWKPSRADLLGDALRTADGGKPASSDRPAEDGQRPFFIHDGMYRPAQDATAIHDGAYRPERDRIRLAPPVLRLQVPPTGEMPPVFVPRDEKLPEDAPSF